MDTSNHQVLIPVKEYQELIKCSENVAKASKEYELATMEFLGYVIKNKDIIGAQTSTDLIITEHFEFTCIARPKYHFKFKRIK